MEERIELERAVADLEARRDTLGDAAVDAALFGLRLRLAELDKPSIQGPAETTAAGYDAERRVLTILFCDVVGSTVLAEGMDPEAWTEIMNVTFEHLIEPIKRYDGTVARLMGDGILAFFGAPTAHEDDPRRAVLAGLAIIQNISPLREKLRSERGLDLDVRVGINTGLAVVGQIGTESDAEYTAMGDAINVAARMEQTAQPGTIQIAQDTFALVATLFEYKSLGGIVVKGKRNPVQAYQILSRKGESGPGTHEIRSSLVGRSKEFSAIQSVLAKLRDGEGGILTILGEAGIGKSRLLAEIYEQALHLPAGNASRLEAPLRWLEGRTLSYRQDISYRSFQEILRSYAGIDEADNQTVAWRKLEIAVTDLFAAETAEVLPYLASLMSLPVADEFSERVKYLDVEALRLQIYRALRLFFLHLARHAPLVLVFEDLHWMDASSASLLEHLLPLVERAPLLIIGLSRPDTGTPGPRLHEMAQEQYRERTTLLQLTPLSTSDSNVLVRNLLRIEDLPNHVQHLITRRADGNPLYLEEIVRELIDDGALVYQSSSKRWRATDRIDQVTVPDTIQGLLQARIDRLDESLKHVVRRAAVIGRSFLFKILNAVVKDNYELENQLAQLEALQLIQMKQKIPELEYIFKHALAQEAAYDGILLQERREIHASVGEAIESLIDDHLADYYGLLAYHFSVAEQWPKAQEYLFKAGDQAGSMAADADALAYYRQAMEVYTRVQGQDWDPFERAQIERKIGEAFYRLGENGLARPYLERSMVLLGVKMPETAWGTRLAIGREFLDQIVHFLLPRRFLQATSDPPDPAAEELFLAALALSTVELHSDVERSILVSLKALNACERGGFAYGSAYLASTIALAFDLMYRHGLGERYSRLAADYARQVRPRRPIARLDITLSIRYFIRGEMEKGLEYAHLAAKTDRSIGELHSWGTAIDMAAWILTIQGRMAEAVAIWQEMIAVAEEGSDQVVLGQGYLGLGDHLRRLGRFDEAAANLLRAIEIARDASNSHIQTNAGAILSRCFASEGDVQQALSKAEFSQRKLKESGIDYNLPNMGNGRSGAYLLAAETFTGAERETFLNQARRSCRETIKAARKYVVFLPEALMLQGRYEWLSGNPQHAQKLWEEGVESAQQIGYPYAEGLLHLETGLRTGVPDHLLRAISLLEEIGAAHELSLARNALGNLQES